jgi:uncharacterized protein (TIGR02246 family)
MPAADDALHAARIRALDEGWAAAAKRRDLDGMLAIYAPDAQELLPQMAPLVGREAIRSFYEGLLNQFPRFAHHFEPEEITVAASGDLAVARGWYAFTPDTHSPKVVQRGKFIGVWCRNGDDWLLRYNIANPDP